MDTESNSESDRNMLNDMFGGDSGSDLNPKRAESSENSGGHAPNASASEGGLGDVPAPLHYNHLLAVILFKALEVARPENMEEAHKRVIAALCHWYLHQGKESQEAVEPGVGLVDRRVRRGEDDPGRAEREGERPRVRDAEPDRVRALVQRERMAEEVIEVQRIARDQAVDQHIQLEHAQAHQHEQHHDCRE